MPGWRKMLVRARQLATMTLIWGFRFGVVLLGATLPFTLILWAGPVALLQAAIVSIVTFGVIFAVLLVQLDTPPGVLDQGSHS